jgi:hypothetical protein
MVTCAMCYGHSTDCVCPVAFSGARRNSYYSTEYEFTECDSGTLLADHRMAPRRLGGGALLVATAIGPSPQPAAGTARGAGAFWPSGLSKTSQPQPPSAAAAGNGDGSGDGGVPAASVAAIAAAEGDDCRGGGDESRATGDDIGDSAAGAPGLCSATLTPPYSSMAAGTLLPPSSHGGGGVRDRGPALTCARSAALATASTPRAAPRMARPGGGSALPSGLGPARGSLGQAAARARAHGVDDRRPCVGRCTKHASTSGRKASWC